MNSSLPTTRLRTENRDRSLKRAMAYASAMGNGLVRTAVFAAALLTLAQPSFAQGKFGGGGLGGFGLSMGSSDPATYEATFTVSTDGKKGTLNVKATIADGYHTYSTTQPPGGPYATSIKLEGKSAKLAGEFKPDHPPEIGSDEVAYGPLQLEEFHGEVIWTAPIEFPNGYESKSDLTVSIDALVCQSSCMPVQAKVKATFTGTEGVEPNPLADAATRGSGAMADSLKSELAKQEKLSSKSHRVTPTHAVWTASLSSATVQPGSTTVLELGVAADRGYHVYEHVPFDPESLNRTLIAVTEKSGLKFGTPVVSSPAEEAPPIPGFDAIRYHGGNFNWKIPVEIPQDTKDGSYPFEVRVAFLTCNDGSCDPPAGLRLKGSIAVGDAKATAAKLELSDDNNREISELPTLVTWIDKDVAFPAATDNAIVRSKTPPDSSEAGVDTEVAEESGPPPTVTSEAPPGTSDNNEISAPPPSAISADDGTPPTRGGDSADKPVQALTLFHVLAALAGGFILNFMPCVLPVIGLKVMSFMNQAGNAHKEVVKLNLAYSAGILAVMLSLALVAITIKVVWGEAFGWGQQFTILEFKVALACLVFAMALSFLGVWEIPIPGFATSSKSGELMEKEGVVGAFLKGILTTVLATPCSGPLLGSLFGLSLVLSSFSVILLYLIVGIGMALPFLVLCIWPGFIRLLPKPGAWMETLKQILAFPLLLTVVFFVAAIGNDYRIATLILLIVVWFACWLIGRVPAYAEKTKVRMTWASSLAIVALGAFVSFSYFGPFDSEIPWQPYDEAQLAQYREEGKTVMLDFTANWCFTCKLNTRFAIDREEVAKLVDKYNVVPMLADWTDRSDAIRQKLEELESNSIPLLAIYPADSSKEPILLRDVLTENQVLEALNEAGPSKGGALFTSFNSGNSSE
ncbi:MAG: protein-disulfide reductase DsbD domain-containing protein [Aureliella sp.]